MTQRPISPSAKADWLHLVDKIAATFRLTGDERKALESNPVARLIGELPYIAGCDEAERTALAHLTVYWLAAHGGRTAFDHSESDNGDPLTRLRLIGSFKGGDQAILAEGMRRLALVQLNGYHRDRAKDQQTGDYNPLNAGAWDYDAEYAKLTTAGKPAAAMSAALDAILPLDETVQGTWI
jgi:hypothetical protein